MDVEWTNRYGVTIAGTLWSPPMPWTDPLTGKVSAGPFPTVLLVSAHFAWRVSYAALAQGLAEEGYVVLQFDVQCHQNKASKCEPSPEFCGEEGWWRDAQEMGIQEPDDVCAGQASPNATGPPPEADLAARMDDASGFQGFYRAIRARYIFGALDALDLFLFSDENPWRNRVDSERLGIVGHSIGAYAAMMVGNGDPQGRFKTAVSLDAYAKMDNDVQPTVPTMFIQSEQVDRVVRPEPPNETSELSHPTRATWNAFRSADVKTMFLVQRGSTHQEFQYTPLEDFALTALGLPPAPGTSASTHGERVGFYYTLAWLDLNLKGSDPTTKAGHHRQDAEQRLAATVFDGSADRSSIGTGAFDIVTHQNIPYTISGDSRAEHLSWMFASDQGVVG